jgi:hypothetical protein
MSRPPLIEQWHFALISPVVETPKARVLDVGRQSWLRLSGQIPADFEWIAAGVC